MSAVAGRIIQKRSSSKKTTNAPNNKQTNPTKGSRDPWANNRMANMVPNRNAHTKPILNTFAWRAASASRAMAT